MSGLRPVERWKQIHNDQARERILEKIQADRREAAAECVRRYAQNAGAGSAAKAA